MQLRVVLLIGFLATALVPVARGLDVPVDSGIVTDVDYATRSIRVGDDDENGRFTIDANTVIRSGGDRIAPAELAVGDRVSVSARESVGLEWPVARTIEVIERRPIASTGSLHTSVKDGRGRTLGMVALREAPNGVLIEVDLRGLPAGAHGFHVHEKGVCEPPFESAGSHLGEARSAHGFLADDGPHAGDLPNLVVPADGRITTELFADGLRFADLRDSDGSSLVIHAAHDDHRSQPAGGAGERIACGVVGDTVPVARTTL